MRLFGTILVSLTLALPLAACGDDDPVNPGDPDAMSDPNSIEVSDDITADTTWTADKAVILKDNIFVRNAELTIEPGTVVKGDTGTSLVITNTGTINATGTASDPIVFTSNVPAGGRAAGDWGGVVLLGKATINVTGGTDNVEGFPAGTEGTEFGGSDDAHDCGTIKYARIEFAGFELSTDNELNGLTVGACGTDTELDFIQVHKGADDGVEFFGGTAGITHLVVSQPDDDGVDWDQGWTGKGQWIIVQQSSTAGNHAMECDSNKNANDAAPRSAPELWNVTLIGSNADPGDAFKTQSGPMLRRGTAGEIHNAIIAYFADYAFDVRGFSSAEQARGGGLAVMNTYFYDNANDVQNGFPTDFDVDPATMDDPGGENDCESNDPDTNCLDEEAFFTGESTNTFGTDPGLGAPLDLTAPDFAPDTPATGGTPPSGFDTSATYIGAIGDTDWTSGWTSYPAN